MRLGITKTLPILTITLLGLSVAAGQRVSQRPSQAVSVDLSC